MLTIVYGKNEYAISNLKKTNSNTKLLIKQNEHTTTNLETNRITMADLQTTWSC